MAIAALAAVIAACGGAPSSASSPSAPQTVTVFAAASLTTAFQNAAPAFSRQHPGFTTRFNFAGSPTLVTQIGQGAPADVFASADQPNMDRARQMNLVEPPRLFASNRLEIVVAGGNPKHVHGLSDLGRSDLVVVLAAPAVPAGNYARQVLARAGVTVSPKSEETDVKAVVSKVALGEADAGIVYVSDVRAGGAKVEGVAIPDPTNIVAHYPIAQVSTSTNAAGARAFIDFITSAAGQRFLADQGFGPP
ncbi:MAG TPA: molybdate ABC transporter substrate-binding protein [Candidatus Dormibacteraeota bacterium]